MIDIAALTAKNARRWSIAKMTRGPEFGMPARRLVAAKNRYLAVQAQTGVPWFIIAVIHERESSQRWDRSLAQGDPWNAVSVHVPRGRGPFKSWEEAAIDALAACHPFLAKQKDWTAGPALTHLENYNGLGYANRGIPSPYVWSGTDQYRSGKYVSDGVFDPNAVDKQLGCAGLILAMRAIDPSVSFGDTSRPIDFPPPPDIPAPLPVGKQSFWQIVGAILAAIFKRK